jgi:Domain of unknown function (DUF1905)
MQNLTYRFTAPLWIYQGKGAWHFVTLPKEAADEIRFFNVSAKGFMPISVLATIGATIKAGVRKAERLSNGQSIEVEVKVKSEI